MADEVDEDAVNDASTALDFIFFFTIISFNSILSLKLISKRGQLLSSARHCLMLGLSAGGIIIALFSYTNDLRADIHFQSKRVTRAIIVASCTLLYYLPFVYAVALIIFGIDIMVRRRWNLITRPQPLSWNVMVTCLPWTLGAVVVYPLVTTNIDWQRSLDHDVLHWTSVVQYRATLFACNILPLCIALGLSMSLRCVYTCRKYYRGWMMSGQSGKLVNALTESETFQTLSHKGRYNPFEIQAPERNNHYNSNIASESKEAEDDDGDLSERILKNEVSLLLTCTFIAFVCSFMWPVYQFLETYNTYQPTVATAMNMVTFYLSQFVPVLLPAVWIWSRH